jgi:hypothetical protein
LRKRRRDIGARLATRLLMTSSRMIAVQAMGAAYMQVIGAVMACHVHTTGNVAAARKAGRLRRHVKLTGYRPRLLG